LGYVQNRLVGSMMSHVRRGRTNRFLGSLAIVHIPSPQKPEIGPQERIILESAVKRCSEQGFSMEIFELELGPRGEAALSRILLARGVTGVIFVYPSPSDAPLQFPWGDFSVLAIDLARPDPVLHTLVHDHYATLSSALVKLRATGYRNAGLFLERYKDERTHYKWSAAFTSFQARQGGIGSVPLLMEEAMTEGAFIDWYRRHGPDLVIGHVDACVTWLKKLGCRVPADVGFFALNCLHRSPPCAGIDPQLELQGKTAADALIAEVQCGERGKPETPRQVLVPGRIVSGPSVRSRLD
ncbi:MAG TPA: substrate-binding domain-containing protein, partial [Opitutaceae bacterium]|nr:substrate-binding domain-containing protein [Opitutaceae bacterium]